MPTKEFLFSRILIFVFGPDTESEQHISRRKSRGGERCQSRANQMGTHGRRRTAGATDAQVEMMGGGGKAPAPPFKKLTGATGARAPGAPVPPAP